jgi:hypothetical protein
LRANPATATRSGIRRESDCAPAQGGRKWWNLRLYRRWQSSAPQPPSLAGVPHATPSPFLSVSKVCPKQLGAPCKWRHPKGRATTPITEHLVAPRRSNPVLGGSLFVLLGTLGVG